MKRFRFSKKLFMALVTAGVIIANEGLDLKLPQDAIYTIAAVAASYIFGQAAVDRKLVETGNKTK